MSLWQGSIDTTILILYYFVLQYGGADGNEISIRNDDAIARVYAAQASKEPRT